MRCSQGRLYRSDILKAIVVGSGLAGVTVAEGLIADPGWEVTLVTGDSLGYYARPRLSHGLSMTEAAVGSLILKPFSQFSPLITLLSKVHASRILRSERLLELSDGRRLPYDRLILATGSAARIPREFRSMDAPFLTLNSLEDLQAMRLILRSATNGLPLQWAIIGGGAIGCELASDLARAGVQVTLFQKAPRLMEMQLLDFQSTALAKHLSSQGVTVLLDQSIFKLPLGFDTTVVCAGFVPRIDLAKSAGLDTNKGIVVNENLQTNDPFIYAAGDVVQVGERLFPFVLPVRSQAKWLVQHLQGKIQTAWSPPAFTPTAKIHEFNIPNTP